MGYTCTYKSELGEILLAADEIGLTGLWFTGQKYFARVPAGSMADFIADSIRADHNLRGDCQTAG